MSFENSDFYINTQYLLSPSCSRTTDYINEHTAWHFSKWLRQLIKMSFVNNLSKKKQEKRNIITKFFHFYFETEKPY